MSAKVAYPNQILPIVHYWIPHVRIISPEGLQPEMEQEVSVPEIAKLFYTINSCAVDFKELLYWQREK